MSVKGKKIGELSQDTVLTGDEKILISDREGSKYLRLDQIYNSEHEQEQTRMIVELEEQLANLKKMSLEKNVQKTNDNGEPLYKQEDGTITTVPSNEPVYETVTVNTETHTQITANTTAIENLTQVVNNINETNVGWEEYTG